MPLHPIGIAYFLTIIAVVGVVLTIGFVRCVWTMRLIGYGGGTLILLGGAAFSTMLYLMNIGMSGDPADLSPFKGLVISVFISVPIYVFAWVRIRKLIMS